MSSSLSGWLVVDTWSDDWQGLGLRRAPIDSQVVAAELREVDVRVAGRVHAQAVFGLISRRIRLDGGFHAFLCDLNGTTIRQLIFRSNSSIHDEEVTFKVSVSRK